MTDTKPEITTELLEKLMSWLDSTESFVVEQSPLIAQEMLAWGWWESTWMLIVLLTAMIASSIFAWKLMRCGVRKLKEDSGDLDHFMPAFCASMIPIGVFIGTAIKATGYISVLIKIHVAPRVYLLEQLQSLLN